MIAPKLISDFVPALSVDDTGEYALMQMHEYNVNNLAVTDGAKYAGLVSMEEVINMKHLNLSLKNLIANFRRPFVYDDAHVYDVMKAAVELIKLGVELKINSAFAAPLPGSGLYEIVTTCEES